MPFVEQGTNVTLSALIRDLLGNLADWDASPAPTITMRTLAGVALSGYPTAVGIVHDSLANYHYVWACGLTQATGTYQAYWFGKVNGEDYSGIETVEVVAPGTVPGPGIVTLAEALSLLGVTAGTTDATWVSRLLDGISAEMRRLCRRGFEGEATTYTETLTLRGARIFTLPHSPVSSITSITRVYLDGSADEAYDSTEYLLEDAETGRVRLGVYSGPNAWPDDWGGAGACYVRVVYVVTGEIPAPIVTACLSWLRTRWDAWAVRADLAGYKTGGDAENYFASLIGRPPRDVARAIASYYHATGGGVV